MVHDPMQGGVGKNEVKFIFKMHLMDVHTRKIQIPSADRACRPDHTDGSIDSQHLSMGHGQRQPFRQDSVAAAQIQYGFIPFER